MGKVIPYGRQEITSTDLNTLMEVMQSDLLTQGPVVPRFEAKLAEITFSKYATAVNSATSAFTLRVLL